MKLEAQLHKARAKRAAWKAVEEWWITAEAKRVAKEKAAAGDTGGGRAEEDRVGGVSEGDGCGVSGRRRKACGHSISKAEGCSGHSRNCCGGGRDGAGQWIAVKAEGVGRGRVEGM